MKVERLGQNQTLLHIVPDNGPIIHILFSYETPVAAWISHQGYMRTAHSVSRTTTKHITDWLASRYATNVQTVPQETLNTLLSTMGT